MFRETNYIVIVLEKMVDLFHPLTEYQSDEFSILFNSDETSTLLTQ